MKINTTHMKLQSMFLVGLLIIQSCQFKQKEPGKALDNLEVSNSSSYHFEPTVNWMNDPNGMVYYAGEYHLFYQHFPDSNVWGPMHWGHAVSEDLIHWKHLPIALYPDSLGFIFSGSAVVDHENTSGLGSKENPPMVAIYTYSNQKEEFKGSITFQNQAIAYSLDSGRSWKKYQGNPVINNPGIKDFRDPKVSWVEEYKKWVMVLAVKDHVSIYSSKNLIDWTHESDFGESLGAHGGVWECPDLFKIKSDKGEEHWVMLVSINPGGLQGGSGTQYFVGDFDGTTFSTSQNDTKWIDFGADNYAGVLYSNIPEEDGRYLFIGWMSNWAYANKVGLVDRKNMMTLPRSISLISTVDDNILAMQPVHEVRTVTSEGTPVSIEKLRSGFETKTAYTLAIVPGQGDSQLIFTNTLGDSLLVGLSQNEISIDRSRCGNVSLSDVFPTVHEVTMKRLEQVSIYMDRSSIELFANNGKVNMTDLFFTQTPLSKVFVSDDTNNIGVVYSPISLISKPL